MSDETQFRSVESFEALRALGKKLDDAEAISTEDIVGMEENVTELNRLVTKLREEADILREDGARLREDCAERQREVMQLTSMLAQIQKDRLVCDDAIRRAKDVQEKEIDRITMVFTRIEAEKSALEDALAASECERKSLNDELDTLRTIGAVNDRDKRNLESRLSSAVTGNGSVELASEDAISEIDVLKSRISFLERDNEELGERIVEMESAQRDLIAAHEEALAAARDDCQKRTQAMNQYEEVARRRKDLIIKANADLTIVRQEKKVLEEELARLKIVR